MTYQATDKLDIMELLNRYNMSIDANDNETWVNCFADDGRYESALGNAQGRDALMQVIVGLHASGMIAGKRHFGGQAVITLQSDEQATATSYFVIFEAKTSAGVVATGLYQDELQKINGSWKLTRRQQTIDPTWQPPTSSART